MANSLIFKGVVGFISDIETGTDKKGNPFEKGYFIVGEPDAKIPNEMKFEWYNRNSPKMLSIGDEVEVSYNSRVKEYNGKHYISISMWSIKNLTNPVEEEQSVTTENKYASLKQPIKVEIQPAQQHPSSAYYEPTPIAPVQGEDGGLPF